MYVRIHYVFKRFNILELLYLVKIWQYVPIS